MTNSIKNTVLLIVFAAFLGGCNLITNQTSVSPESILESELINQSKINSVMAGESQIAYLDKGFIKIVDIKNTFSVPVYKLETNQLPTVNAFNTIKISPSKKFLVWYAPQSGYVKINLENNQLNIFQTSNQWLNNNPYFDFSQDGEYVYYVNDEGERFYSHNLITNQTNSVAIPFPFGNTFKISPDSSAVIFVSAFGQTDENPEYLITDMDGNNPVRFSTSTVLSKRSNVAWMPDSSGVVLIGETNQLLFVDKSSGQITNWYTHTTDATIEGLYERSGMFYYKTNDNWWFVINPNSQKIEGRVPSEIAQDLHRPVFIPWDNKTFLIEERIRQETESFNRLWQSNFMGVKSLILTDYNRTEIIDDTPSI